MNNSINTITPMNSAINFKATLKTPIKTGAMPEIADEFARITKNVKGTLEFNFASSEAKSSGLKEFVYNGISYVTRKANKYVDYSAENLDKTEINKAAKLFADVLSALKVENSYVQKIKPHEDEILYLEKQARTENAKKKRAEKYELQGLVDIYTKNIENINKSKEKEEAFIEKHRPAWYQAMVDRLEKYKDHELLDDYVDFIKMDS